MFTAIDGPQLVFVNGHYSEALSQVRELPAGVGGASDVRQETVRHRLRLKTPLAR